MSKISMRQVYFKILSRQEDVIRERTAERREVFRYDFSDFESDMRSGDLISTIGTIKSKWDAMAADRVLEIPANCKPYTWGIVWIDSLKAASEGRRLVRASLPRTDEASVCMCVSAKHCHGEEGAQ